MLNLKDVNSFINVSIINKEFLILFFIFFKNILINLLNFFKFKSKFIKIYRFYINVILLVY